MRSIPAICAALCSGLVFISVAEAQGGGKGDRVLGYATMTGVAVELIREGKPLPKQKSPQDMTLILIDGKSGAERGVLGDGVVINRAAFEDKADGLFSVRAELPGKGAKSVRFFINDAPSGFDTTEPFTLFGDASDAKDGYNRQHLPATSFKIRAVAFSGADGDGPVLSDKSVFIEIE